IQVLEQLQHLLDAVGAAALDAGPVRILGELAATNDALYAPLVYGYVNYTRPGYARFPLRFAPIPVGDGISGAVLGGAGLGISAWSRHREVALRFAEWVSGPECQSTLYVQHGGQPGLRGAWHGPFFEDARPLVERAWVRPTWDGYTDLQSAAGRALHVFFRRQASASATVHHLNQLYLRRDLNSYASR
ncbi:MAG: hypothetical protein JNL98_37645, partial [Bryobacterales bacterium]|nr:hypothetical protein [Bryobacterales bacterium]